jgi:anthranilate phosphoribosyltransferase
MQRFDAGHPNLLDTCGTGGDGSCSFNISTAAALVAAGTGAKVVKHGNRAVSSRSGSADVLAELGVRLDAGLEETRLMLNRVGFAFCFAPNFHPALKHLGPLRKRLGVRTILNLLGPLANPAGAAYQLLGVGRHDLLDRMAKALSRLGVRQAYVVCADGGFDEVSLWGETHFRRVCNGEVSSGIWTPADFGLAACDLSDLKAADAAESARIIEGVLLGSPGAATRVVVANAAAALLAADHVRELRAGVALAEEAISTGRARSVLEGLRGSR